MTKQKLLPLGWESYIHPQKSDEKLFVDYYLSWSFENSLNEKISSLEDCKKVPRQNYK